MGAQGLHAAFRRPSKLGNLQQRLKTCAHARDAELGLHCRGGVVAGAPLTARHPTSVFLPNSTALLGVNGLTDSGGSVAAFFCFLCGRIEKERGSKTGTPTDNIIALQTFKIPRDCISRPNARDTSDQKIIEPGLNAKTQVKYLKSNKS
jgi:hypothetical protein